MHESSRYHQKQSSHVILWSEFALLAAESEAWRYHGQLRFPAGCYLTGGSSFGGPGKIVSPPHAYQTSQGIEADQPSNFLDFFWNWHGESQTRGAGSLELWCNSCLFLIPLPLPSCEADEVAELLATEGSQIFCLNQEVYCYCVQCR